MVERPARKGEVPYLFEPCAGLLLLLRLLLPAGPVSCLEQYLSEHLANKREDTVQISSDSAGWDSTPIYLTSRELKTRANTF